MFSYFSTKALRVVLPHENQFAEEISVITHIVFMEKNKINICLDTVVLCFSVSKNVPKGLL